MRKAIGFVFAIILAAGWVVYQNFIAPSVEVEIANSTGSGWDGARVEMLGQFRQVMSEGDWAAFGLQPAAVEVIAGCTADKAIVFLNTTDCSYLYNEALKTEAEHLADQEACLTRVGYEQREEQFTLECMQQHFPGDWSHLSQIIREMFVATFTSEGATPEVATQAATCIAEKVTTLVNTRKCPLVNKAAKRAEDLFHNLDSCIKDPDNDAEYQALVQTCMPQAAEQPAPGKK